MQIETGIGFQNLRSMLNEWVGDKMRQGRSGRVSRRYRGAQLPEIQRENDNEPEIQSDGNTAISRNESDLPVDNLWLIHDKVGRAAIPDVEPELELNEEQDIEPGDVWAIVLGPKIEISASGGRGQLTKKKMCKF